MLCEKQGTIIEKITIRPALSGLPWEASHLGSYFKVSFSNELVVGRMRVWGRSIPVGIAFVKV